MNDIQDQFNDHQQGASTAPKQQSGNAGTERPHLRTRRVETRVSPDEHAAICARALSQGSSSVAQFVREQALYGADSPCARHKALLACQRELNDITSHVNQIARHLTQGDPLDEEMLMVTMQILDLAEENLKRVTQGQPEAL